MKKEIGILLNEVSEINEKIRKICKHDGDVSFVQKYALRYPQYTKVCNICGGIIKIYEHREDYLRDKYEHEISEHEKSIANLKENLEALNNIKNGK